MKWKSIEITVSNYEETVVFYTEFLGLPYLERNQERTVIAFSDQRFILQHDQENKGYYYHLAFNIMKNSFTYLKDKLARRIGLATEDGKDEVDYPLFNAKSFYFIDPAGNIMEFITRDKEICNPETKEINQLIYGIGEVGFPAKDAIALVEKLKQHTAEAYNESNEVINFVGNIDYGEMFIIVTEGRRWVFSTKLAKRFPLRVESEQFILGIDENTKTYFQPIGEE